MVRLPKLRSKSGTDEVSRELTREYRYASHHHLIPLYILSGINVVALVIISVFLIVLWQYNERESFRPTAITTVQTIENRYLPAPVSPAEKKQYIYSANVRFPVTSPYGTLRYAYDPGITATKTSAILTLTTTRTLETLAGAVLDSPNRANELQSRMEECARVYIIRFEPGLTQYGNFAPLKDIKLKDGRTAYIHKNTSCVPDSVQAMNELDATEKDILAIESF